MNYLRGTHEHCASTHKHTRKHERRQQNLRFGTVEVRFKINENKWVDICLVSVRYSQSYISSRLRYRAYFGSSSPPSWSLSPPTLLPFLFRSHSPTIALEMFKYHCWKFVYEFNLGWCLCTNTRPWIGNYVLCEWRWSTLTNPVFITQIVGATKGNYRWIRRQQKYKTPTTSLYHRNDNSFVSQSISSSAWNVLFTARCFESPHTHKHTHTHEPLLIRLNAAVGIRLLQYFFFFSLCVWFAFFCTVVVLRFNLSDVLRFIHSQYG